MLDKDKPVKVIIQIPCYNEEEALPITLKTLPRHLPGIDKVEWLIVNDGSTDKTVQVAKENGVDHIVSFPTHQGLAKVFMAGLSASIKAGADIIVNTDADNQYSSEDIPKLLEPILNGEAEIVVGARPIENIEHFSRIKKLLQKLGSWAVQVVSRTEVADAPSGFRAMTREAAMQLNVFNEYTYTLETIIQAGQKGIAIKSVPIRTNKDLRPSRLFSSMFSYIKRSVMTIIRIFVIYRPFRFFVSMGLIAFSMGLIIGFRFLWFYINGEGYGHIQSLILTAILLIIGFFLFIVGFLSDVISVNRKILEKIDWRLYQLEEKSRKKQNN